MWQPERAAERAARKYHGCESGQGEAPRRDTHQQHEPTHNRKGLEEIVLVEIDQPLVHLLAGTHSSSQVNGDVQKPMQSR